MINSSINSSFKVFAQAPSTLPSMPLQQQHQQQNPFLALPMMPHSHMQQTNYDMNGMQQQQVHHQHLQHQQQQQDMYNMHHQMLQQQQQHQQQNQVNQRQIQMQMPQYQAMSTVSSQVGDADSIDYDGDSVVMSKNPEQVKQYFEEFLAAAKAIDPTNIQLDTVSDQYNISFKSMPSDEEMKGDFYRMIEKYNSSSQKGQKKNWNENETKILCWIVIKACALKYLDCRSIEDHIWDDIAKILIGRTSEGCKFKWLSLSKLNLQQIPWSAEEDNLLLQTIKQRLNTKYGEFNATNKNNKWSEISKELNSKSKKNVFRQGKQCRERWNNHLDPSINRDPWTDDEDLSLLKLIIEKGKKWSDVSKELRSNRTENNVKNRFNSILKKERQSLEELSKNSATLEISLNSSENEIILYLIKKYKQRISNGFTPYCKEEEPSQYSNTSSYQQQQLQQQQQPQIQLSQQQQQSQQFQPQSQPSYLNGYQNNAPKGESPMTKVEMQKNKLKNLIQSEVKTKETSQMHQQQHQQQQVFQQIPRQQSSQTMQSEESQQPQLFQNYSSQSSISQYQPYYQTDMQQKQPYNQQQQQQQSQQQQQPQPYQSYFSSQFLGGSTDTYQSTTGGFNQSYLSPGSEQMSSCQMSPNGSMIDPQSKQGLQKQQQQHIPQQSITSLSQINQQPMSSSTSSSTHPFIHLLSTSQLAPPQAYPSTLNLPSHIPQLSSSALPSQTSTTDTSSQIKDFLGTYKIRNATELLNSSPEILSSMSLAFFNPTSHELIEVDQQLLEEYTSQQVRNQLNQYTQNLKTPQQTPQQTPTNSFHMMFQSLSNQIQQQQGSNSPQYNSMYTKASSPNNILQHLQNNNPSGAGAHQLMGMIGTPISPQANIFAMLPNLSPSGTSGFNTPNEMNNSSEEIRRINQMQQYADFFRMNTQATGQSQQTQQQQANPQQPQSQQQQQQQQQKPQQQYQMYNNNSSKDTLTFSPQIQATVAPSYYQPGN